MNTEKVHVTDLEAAINWWRERSPSPDGISAAPEVRALAQRSSEAAKEIKSLISTSSQHVGRGVELLLVGRLDRVDVLVHEGGELLAQLEGPGVQREVHGSLPSGQVVGAAARAGRSPEVAMVGRSRARLRILPVAPLGSSSTSW